MKPSDSNIPSFDSPAILPATAPSFAKAPVSRRLTIPLCAALALLIGGFCGIIIWQQHFILRQTAQHTLLTARTESAASIKAQTILLRMEIEALSRDKAISRALQEGNRQQLLQDFQPFFERLRNEHAATHLYAIATNRVCILRSHNPEKYGDTIQHFSLQEAERTGRPFSGLEIGTFGTLTLRVVCPVFTDGALAGYIELGKETGDIFNDLVQTDSILAALLLKKEFLDRAQWENGMQMLGRPAAWKRFPNHVLVWAAQPVLDRLCDQLPINMLASPLEDIFQVQLTNQFWAVMAAPIHDAASRVVGTMLVFHDFSSAQILFQHMIRLIVVAGAGGTALLVFVLLGLLRSTDRVIAAQAAQLQVTRDFLAATLHSIGDGVIVTDREGRIMEINPAAARLTGWTRTEAYGRPLTEVFRIVNEQTMEKAENPVARALREGAIVSLANSTLLIARDGTQHPIADSAAPIRNAQNGISGAALVFSNQSQTRATQRALQQKIALENFLADFSARCLSLSGKKLDDSIQSMLAKVGQLLAVDSAGIFLLDAQKQTVSNSHEWTAEGVQPQRAHLQQIRYASFPWWMGKLERGETIEIADINALPKAAAAEQAVLRKRERRAALFVPIKQGEILHGSLGISMVSHTRAWAAEEKYILQALANILAFLFEHIHNENALRDSEKWHRLLFEAAGDAILTITPPDWFFATGNPAAFQMFGIKDNAELSTFAFWELAPEHQPDGESSETKAQRLFTAALRKSSVNFEWMFQRLDGRSIPCAVTMAPLEIAGKTFLHLVARDISAQKEAERRLLENQRILKELNARLQQNQAQLVQSEKMASIGQLAAGVAHEINNPMGFIGSNLNTLADYVGALKAIAQCAIQLAERHGDTAEARAIAELRRRHDLDYILEDVDHLIAESADGARRVKEIVQSLKSFSRLDEAETKEANLNDCLETTLRVVWNELKYKCEVRRAYGKLPLLRCHPGQLNQVFMNLLVNAAQAIPEKGVITITTAADEKEIRVTIADTGRGIAPEHLPHIFEPFFTTKPVGQGTGLGLSVSYNIVRKHGGHIEASSNPGQGTTFTIHLPRAGVPDHEQLC